MRALSLEPQHFNWWGVGLPGEPRREAPALAIIIIIIMMMRKRQRKREREREIYIYIYIRDKRMRKTKIKPKEENGIYLSLVGQRDLLMTCMVLLARMRDPFKTWAENKAG